MSWLGSLCTRGGSLDPPLFVSSRYENATSPLTCGIISFVEMNDRPGLAGRQPEIVALGRWVGLQGRSARRFWGGLGVWAVLCGALSTGHLRWDADRLLPLAMVLLLSELAWGSLWDLATHVDWFRLIRARPAGGYPKQFRGLPYTLPHAPGGRLARAWGWAGHWWREVFWPAAGQALMGGLAALALAVVLSLLLPSRLRTAYAALAALLSLGVLQGRGGREPLAGQAFLQVGLSWVAGSLALAEGTQETVLIALAFSVAAWGALRADRGLGGGRWLLNGGLLLVVGLMIAWEQPLVAGLLALLFFGPLALQLSAPGEDTARAGFLERVAPWLMAAMLAAAVGLL